MITRLSEETSATIFRVKNRTGAFLFGNVLFHQVFCNFCMMSILFRSFIMAALICNILMYVFWEQSGVFHVMMFRNQNKPL